MNVNILSKTVKVYSNLDTRIGSIRQDVKQLLFPALKAVIRVNQFDFIYNTIVTAANSGNHRVITNAGKSRQRKIIIENYRPHDVSDTHFFLYFFFFKEFFFFFLD